MKQLIGEYLSEVEVSQRRKCIPKIRVNLCHPRQSEIQTLPSTIAISSSVKLYNSYTSVSISFSRSEVSVSGAGVFSSRGFDQLK